MKVVSVIPGKSLKHGSLQKMVIGNRSMGMNDILSLLHDLRP